MSIEWSGGVNVIHIIFLVAILFSVPFFRKKNRVPMYIFSFLILFFFLSIRLDYGNDYDGYLGIYMNIKSGIGGWGSNDIAFKFLNQISPTFRVFIVLQSFIYMMTIFLLMNKFLTNSNMWQGLMLLLINPYFFLIHLSGIRQTLAMCMFILAVLLFINGKKIYGLLMTILAVMFHKSALILLPIILFLNKKKNKIFWIYIMFFTTLILLLTPLFNKVVEIVIPYFPTHYATVYLSENVGNSILSTLMSFVIYVLILLNYDKLEDEEIILGKLAIIGSSISILTYRISMLTRVQSYFDIFLIVLFPIILNKQGSKLKKIIIFSLILGVYLLRYYSFFTNPLWTENYRHYKSIFTF